MTQELIKTHQRETFLGSGDVKFLGKIGAFGDYVLKWKRNKLAFSKIEAVHPALGVLADVIEVCFGSSAWRIKRDEPRIIIVATVNRTGPQPEHQTHHAGLWVDVFVPNKQEAFAG